MATLLFQLRDRGPSGGSAESRLVFDDLLASLDPTAEPLHQALLGAAEISKLGESVAAQVTTCELQATPAELAAVNAWVRNRLLGCIDALTREQEAAAARQATLRALFAAAGIVVVELDRKLRFRWVYDQTTGPFPNESIVGHSLFEIGDPRSAEIMAEHMRRVLDTGLGYQAEVSILTRESSKRSMLVYFEPTRDAAGEITGVIGVSSNITELSKAQEQLRNAVTFREEMMAVLAHDLRNPLSAVRGLASIYERKASLPDDVREGIGHIARAGTRMDELIGTLLDFSTARFHGSIPMAPGAADLAETARSVLGELRLAMPERLIEFTARGDTSCQFDAARISQLISNLLSNALTHGAKSEPVKLLIDGSGARLRLSVSNAGAPIPLELIPILFEPFRRGASQPRQPDGLGLGLYIAKQIALGHGGTLEVESSAERGTVFTLELPRG